MREQIIRKRKDFKYIKEVPGPSCLKLTVGDRETRQVFGADLSGSATGA